jgi:hypothetical protein
MAVAGGSKRMKKGAAENKGETNSAWLRAVQWGQLLFSQASPEHGPCSDQGVQETLAWAAPLRASLAVPTGTNANATAESTVHAPRKIHRRGR